MRTLSTLVLFLLFQCNAFATDDCPQCVLEDDLMVDSAIETAAMAEAKSILNQSTRKSEVETLAADIVSEAIQAKDSISVVPEDENMSVGKLSIDDGFWQTAQQAQALLDRAIQRKSSSNKYGSAEGFVFISKSIPDNDLASLIYEVTKSKRRIAFVIRGAEPMRYLETIKHFIDIDESIRSRLIVDPTLFQKLGVQTVPTFVLKNEDNEWQRTSGNVSLKAVESHFATENELMRLGKTYDIVEPDMIELMKARASAVDWESWIKQQTQQMLTSPYESGLLVAQKASSILIDPRHQIKKDIVLKGHVFGRAGQWINPLEIQPLSKCYVVADFSLASHKRAVDRLVADCNKITAMTVEPLDIKQAARLVPTYGEIRAIDPMVKSRFKLTEIPVLARQEGLAVRLTTLPPVIEK